MDIEISILVFLIKPLFVIVQIYSVLSVIRSILVTSSVSSLSFIPSTPFDGILVSEITSPSKITINPSWDTIAIFSSP